MPRHASAISIALAATVATAVADAALIGVFAPPADANAAVLVNDSDWSGFRSRVADMGHTIVPIADFAATDLSQFDAIITMNAYTPATAYTPDAVAAITAFVDAGKGLGLFADGGFASDTLTDNYNTLASAFGFEFGGMSNGMGIVVDGLAPHPMTAGIDAVGGDFTRSITVSGDAASLTGSTGTSRDFLAYNDAADGRGNIAAIGDVSLFKNTGAQTDFGIGDASNTQFLQNTINYLLVPTPGSAVVLLAGVVMARRRSLGRCL